MDMREINASVIEEFRANDGVLSGPMEGAPILLLTTNGKRSKAAHTTPVGFIDTGNRLVAAAANGGANHHPDWFLNIENDNRVIIEIPGHSMPSLATIATGTERTELLHQLSEALPGMSDHVAATTREIPVVIFRATN